LQKIGLYQHKCSIVTKFTALRKKIKNQNHNNTNAILSYQNHLESNQFSIGFKSNLLINPLRPTLPHEVTWDFAVWEHSASGHVDKPCPTFAAMQSILQRPRRVGQTDRQTDTRGKTVTPMYYGWRRPTE